MNMNYSNFTAALDMGATHITLAIATKTTDKLVNIIDYEKVASTSIRWGKILNEIALAKEIQSLILRVQQRNNMIIEKIYVSSSSVGLYSSHINISKTLGAGSIVTQELLNSLINSEELALYSNKDSRLYCEPLSYKLNGEKENDVLGKQCQRIDADYLTIDADSDTIQRIKNTFKYAEVSLADIFLSANTIAEATLTENEKINGVAILEIGMASTKLAIYKDKKLQYASTMPLGCTMILKDLCNVLNISNTTAEKLLANNKFGAVCVNLVEDAEMELQTNSGIVKNFSTRQIVEIIEDRLDEILQNVKNQIEKSGFMNLLIGGLVVTGEVLQIENLTNFISSKTNFNVRIADISKNISNDSVKKLLYTEAELCGTLMLGENICKKVEKKKEIESNITTPNPNTTTFEPKKKLEKKEKSNFLKNVQKSIIGLFDDNDTELL